MGEAGLIDRRQGARARVIGRTPGTSYTVSVGSAEDLQAYANATYFEIEQVARFEVTAPLSRFLRSRTRKEWLVLSGNRKDAKTGDTVGYTEVYLWAEFEPYLPKITSRGSPIHQQIDDNLGIRAISIFQEIAAVPMPAVAASALRREPGSPALEIVRRYFGTRGRAFEVARNLHAAESFTFTQEFQRHEIVGEI
jgi:DNA-binding GntR family transcriptional regulator